MNPINSKSVGFDETPAIYLKTVTVAIRRPLTHTIKQNLKTGTFQKTLK